MAVRNTLVEVADGDQLNEGYFNGILKREAYVELIPTSSSTSSTSYVTLQTIDVSAESTLQGYRIFYQVQGVAITANDTATFQLLITFDDATTTTHAVGTVTYSGAANKYSLFIDEIETAKRISTVEIQAKMGTGAGAGLVIGITNPSSTPQTLASFIKIK